MPQGILPPCLLPHSCPETGNGLNVLAVCASEEDEDAARSGSYVLLLTGVLGAVGDDDELGQPTTTTR